MTVDIAGIAIGFLMLAGASVAAGYLKRRMNASPDDIEAVGWAMTLMIANILQLVGIVVVLAGIF